MNSIHFCVSEKVFIYPLLLEALLGASNSRLTFFFSFSILKMLLVCLLAFVVTDEKSAEIVTLFHCRLCIFSHNENEI